MLVTLDFKVVCTINDAFALMEEAVQEVKIHKPLDDQSAYLPEGPTNALQILIRTAIANRLLPLQSVTLHEIGQTIG